MIELCRVCCRAECCCSTVSGSRGQRRWQSCTAVRRRHRYTCCRSLVKCAWWLVATPAESTGQRTAIVSFSISRISTFQNQTSGVQVSWLLFSIRCFLYYPSLGLFDFSISYYYCVSVLFSKYLQCWASGRVSGLQKMLSQRSHWKPIATTANNQLTRLMSKTVNKIVVCVWVESATYLQTFYVLLCLTVINGFLMLPQVLTYNGFYDSNLEFVSLDNVQIVASMNSGNSLGRHQLTSRFTSIVRLCSIGYAVVSKCYFFLTSFGRRSFTFLVS